jgi:hypothetical protein
MRRRDDASVADHAWKADGNTVKRRRERCRKICDRAQQDLGLARIRGRHADPLHKHPAGAIEDRRLEPRAADIDRQGPRTISKD